MITKRPGLQSDPGLLVKRIAAVMFGTRKVCSV
jgi:hypothetical protein